MNRRDVLRSFAAGTACSVLAPMALAHLVPQPVGTGEPVTDFLLWKPAGKGAFVGVGSGGNSTLLMGTDAGVVIDCKNAPYGECLRREATKRCKKIQMVINTHHHGDHTGGNHAFSSDIEIVAQDNCTPRVLGQMNRYLSQMKEAATQLKEGTGPVIEQVRSEALALYKRCEKMEAINFAPKTTFSATREVALPGLKATLHHLGAGHTDNDIVIHVPELNLLVCGDLLFHKMHPFVDKDSGANTRAWQSSLRKCLDLCNATTIVVPGHGDITDATALKAQIAYFDAVRDFVAAAIKDGKSRSDIAGMALPKFGDYGLRQMSSSGLMTVFDELKAEAQAQAEPTK